MIASAGTSLKWNAMSSMSKKPARSIAGADGDDDARDLILRLRDAREQTEHEHRVAEHVQRVVPPKPPSPVPPPATPA